MKKRRRSWWTYSLRMLLGLMLLCGCGLGMIGRESRLARRRAEVAKELSKAASEIEIEYVNLWDAPTQARPPGWQASLLGENWFHHVTGVVIERPDLLDGALLSELRHLRSLEWAGRITEGPVYGGTHRYQRTVLIRSPGNTMLSVEHIEFDVRAFSGEQAAGLKPLRNLEKIALSGADVSDEGLACISPLNPLESLDLSYTRITDRGLEHVARFDKLKKLDVSRSWITDRGLKHLAALPQLEAHRLVGVMVSDEGLRALSHSRSLKKLELDRLAISAEGVATLSQIPSLQSVAVGQIVFPAPRLRDLQMGGRASELNEEIERPSVFWAVDRTYAPNGLPYFRWLLDQGADPNEPRAVGGVAPLAAFVQQDDLELVKVLFEYAADPNRADASGRTALAIAAEMENVKMMQWLIEHGAKVNRPGSASALGCAASAGQLDAMRFLVEHGAEINLPNQHVDSPLHLAVGKPDVVRYLLKLGADANARNSEDDTPLHFAARICRDRVEVAMLLDASADPSLQNEGGRTPADIAAYYGNDRLQAALDSHLAPSK